MQRWAGDRGSLGWGSWNGSREVGETMSPLDQTTDPTPRQAASGALPGQTSIEWPPMSLACLGFLTACYAFYLVVFLTTHDLRLAGFAGRIILPLLLIEQTRRASRFPRVEPRPFPMWARITTVLAILFAIFILFDVVDQPRHRLLPQVVYDVVSAPFMLAGSLLTPSVVFTLFAALQGWYLFGGWRYWSSHALDPRRSPSP